MESGSQRTLREHLKPWLARYFGEHFFLIMAVLFAVWVLRGVPQVYHVWQPRSVVGPSGVAYIALLVLLGYLYITSAIKFLKPDLRIGWLLLPAGFIIGWFGYLNRKLTALLPRPLFYALCLLLVLSGVWLLSAYTLASSTTPYLLFGGFAQMVGLWLLAAATWMALGYRRWGDSNQASAERKQGFAAIWPSLGRVLSWIAMLGLLVELCWATAAAEVPMASFRLYTVSSIIHFAMLCIVFAALADLIQTHSIIPARWVFLPLVLTVVLTSGASTVADPPPPPRARAAMPDSAAVRPPTGWIDALEQRIDQIPPGPIVLVAASGGGSRAALFTSLILQMMAREPFPRLPQLIPSQQQDTDPGNWADRIAMISSVSGGSLASARYAFSNYDAGATIDELKYTTRSELIHESLDSLQAMRQDAHNFNPAARCGSESDGDPRTDIVREADCDMQQLIEAVERVQNEPTALVDDAIHDVVRTAFTSRLADEMSMDFMAPMLRGFITPSASRGNGLYHFWNHQFDWHDISQHSTPYDRTRPLLLLNASDADTGQRVTVGFPPLDPGFLPGALELSVLDTDLTRGDFDPVALSDFSAEPIDLSLARAVRLSSNFPFGFNVNEFSDDSQPPLIATADAKRHQRTLRLMDGGVVDNSGFDSLHAVFESLAVLAERNPEGRESILLNRIRGRGVVIVEIDSGAKPKRHVQGIGASFLSLPINGLSNASYTNSLRNVDRLQSELRDILSIQHNDSLAANLFDPNASYTTDLDIDFTGQQLIAAVATMTPSLNPIAETPQIMHFKFVCSKIEQENSAVMTAFALGPSDKAIVTNMFLIETLNWRRQVQNASKNYRDSVRLFDELSNSENFDAEKAAFRQRLLQIANQESQALLARRERLDGSRLSSEEIQRLDSLLTRAAIPYTAAEALKEQAESDTPAASYTVSGDTVALGADRRQLPGIAADVAPNLPVAIESQADRAHIGGYQSNTDLTATTAEPTRIETETEIASEPDATVVAATESTDARHQSIDELSRRLRDAIEEAASQTDGGQLDNKVTQTPLIELSKPTGNWQEIIKKQDKNY